MSNGVFLISYVFFAIAQMSLQNTKLNGGSRERG